MEGLSEEEMGFSDDDNFKDAFADEEDDDEEVDFDEDDDDDQEVDFDEEAVAFSDDDEGE